ncbi:MAG: 4'-phosphopantetheinyl transferase superfamily protein [Gammaproteobacteria bacterium]|nr:4'-phosphopantetheinyl transferase superfamily protein [Gammaproteobacteria bacterium]
MGLQAHPVVDELSRIAPELLIKGGSFSEWLPHPHDVRRGAAHGLLLGTQRQATRECLIDLLATAGLPATEPERLASGARAWPSGYIGSVSHKGTTVAAAIARTDRMTSIGIDIERLDGKGVPELRGLDAPEHPPSFSDATGREVLFSVKEAAYKALHPVHRRRLDFPDVAVSWLSSGAPRLLGVARACGSVLEVRCSVAVPPWIVSAALWPMRGRALQRAAQVKMAATDPSEIV